jgi:hypothetical protein
MAKKSTDDAPLPPDVNPNYQGPRNGPPTAPAPARTRLVNRNAYVKALARICDILAAFDPDTAKSIIKSVDEAMAVSLPFPEFVPPEQR